MAFHMLNQDISSLDMYPSVMKYILPYILEYDVIFVFETICF
eukprot:UN08005